MMISGRFFTIFLNLNIIKNKKMKKMILLILTTALAQTLCVKKTLAQDWRPFPGGSLNNNVTAIIKHDGYIWVGGSFTQAGTVSAQNIVRHDGSQWIATPALPNTPFGFVVYNNELYALGGFKIGQQTFGAMKWTGSTWQALAQIDSWGIIETGAVYNGKLILGGLFYSVNGITSESLISYDGAVWQSFGGPISCFWIWPSRINDLHVANGFLYVAGAFDQIGGIASSCSAKWNGANWLNLNISWNTYASIVENSGTDVFVGGIFPYAGSSTSKRVAKEGLGYWVNAGNGVQMNVFASANHLGRVYIAGGVASAGGDYIGNCGYWNGATWVRDDQGIKSGTILVLYSDPNEDILFAGGDFKTINGDTANYIAYKSERSLGEVSLPVELLSFDCRYEDESYLFFWETATEVNANYFKLSVSGDGTKYEPILIIQAHGNSSQTNYYSNRVNEEYLPIEIIRSPYKYFRLEEYDYDGSLSGVWSCVKKIKSKAELSYDSNSGTVSCVDCDEPIYIFDSVGRVKKEGYQEISTEGLAFGLYTAKTANKKILRFGINFGVK